MPHGLVLAALHVLHLLLMRLCWQMPPLRTPCTCSFADCAGRRPPLRSPCTGSFSERAGRCSPQVELLEPRRHGLVLVCYVLEGGLRLHLWVSCEAAAARSLVSSQWVLALLAAQVAAAGSRGNTASCKRDWKEGRKSFFSFPPSPFCMDLCGRVSRRSCHACRPLSARGSSCPAHSRPSVYTVTREPHRFPPTHLLSLRSDATVRLSGWVLNASHLQLPCTRADKQLASLEAQKCGLALVLLHTNRQDCQRPHDSESYSVYIVNCAARLTAM